MSEPNPYESPREPQPLTRAQIAKRAVGVAAVLLLTPPAMIIAVFCCCSTSLWVQSNFAEGARVVMPFAVLAILMTVATVLEVRSKAKGIQSWVRVAYLVGTPFAVAGACIAGLLLGGMAYPAGTPTLMLLGFFTPPSLALVLMLWLAWRAGEPMSPAENNKTATNGRSFDDR